MWASESCSSAYLVLKSTRSGIQQAKQSRGANSVDNSLKASAMHSPEKYKITEKKNKTKQATVWYNKFDLFASFY